MRSRVLRVRGKMVAGGVVVLMAMTSLTTGAYALLQDPSPAPTSRIPVDLEFSMAQTEPLTNIPLGMPCAPFETFMIEEGPMGRWFTPGRRLGAPTHIVIHTTESDREPGGELNVASWLARTDYRASAHFVIGPERTLRTVDLADTAWGVGSIGNATGVQLELIGHAHHDRDTWLLPDGQALLCRAAALTAALSVTYDIPLRRVEVQGLRDGVAGVAGHHAYTLAFGGSTHTDPGDGFPWDSFLAQAASMLDAAVAAGQLPADVLKPDLPSGVPAGTPLPEEGELAELSELRRIISELDQIFDELAFISRFGTVIDGVNGPGDPYEGFGKGDDPEKARVARTTGGGR